MRRLIASSEESNRHIENMLRGYIRENAGLSGQFNGASTEPLNARSLDRLMAFRYIPLFEEWRAALERLEEGTYGFCMLCRRPIPKEHLEADPLLRFCRGCERGLRGLDDNEDIVSDEGAGN